MAISMFCLCCEQIYLRMWKKRTDWQEISPQQQLVWEAPALGSMVSRAYILADLKHYIEERLTYPFFISLFLQISLSFSLLVLHSDARVSITKTRAHTKTHCIIMSALIASWIFHVIIIFIIESIKIIVIIINTLLTVLTLCVMSRHWCGQEGVPSSWDGWRQHVNDGKN